MRAYDPVCVLQPSQMTHWTERQLAGGERRWAAVQPAVASEILPWHCCCLYLKTRMSPCEVCEEEEVIEQAAETHTELVVQT